METENQFENPSKIVQLLSIVLFPFVAIYILIVELIIKLDIARLRRHNKKLKGRQLNSLEELIITLESRERYGKYVL